jgi:hypothetical protein
MEQFYTYLAGQAFISVLPKKTPGSNLPINTTRTIQSSIPVHIKRKPVNKQVIIKGRGKASACQLPTSGIPSL